MWRHFFTLRFKLAALFLVVFGVLLTVICLAVLVTRERDLWEQFDERLKDRALVIVDEIAIAPFGRSGDGSLTKRRGRRNPFRFPGYYFQLRLADGTVAERSPNLGGHRLPLTHAGRGSRKSAVPVLETITGTLTAELSGRSGGLRLLTLYHHDPEGPPFFLQMGVSTFQIENSVWRLRRVYLVTVPAGLLLAGIAAWYLARRSLAPLTRIAEVAEQLRADNLSLRFDPPSGQDEVAALVTTINRMLDRISAAIASQERFIADAAHELKTPLTVLLGEAQILMQHDRNPEEYARFVASVQDEARTLAQTVGSLLTLARAEAGIPMAGVSEVSVNEMVMNAVERTSPLAKQREVRLVPTLAWPDGDRTEPLVLGDESLLGVMVVNLLRNAIRYSPPDEGVDIIVDLTGHEARISVRDHGPGIPDEYLDRVFDRFFRVPDPKVAFQGAGLGLTIVRGVAELHGGTVEVSNRAEGGCEFAVRLPLIGKS